MGPLSGEQIYREEIKEELIKKNAEIKPEEISKIAAEKWGKLTAEEKATYEEKAKRAKEEKKDAEEEQEEEQEQEEAKDE